MPRKKVDPVVDLLHYFATEPLAVADAILRIATRAVKERHEREDPPTAKATRTPRRKKQLPGAPQPLGQRYYHDAPGGDARTPVTMEVRLRRRRGPNKAKRMTAESPRPANEATPIVSQVSEVGDSTPTGD